jgi:hypothetical protein
MFKEPVETTLSPSNLTDKELIRFAEEFADGNGMPHDFQKELLRRFILRII